MDCYTFGVHAHDTQDYYHTIMWMEEAYERLQHEKDSTLSPITIYDYLAFACYNVREPCLSIVASAQFSQVEPVGFVNL